MEAGWAVKVGQKRDEQGLGGGKVSLGLNKLYYRRAPNIGPTLSRLNAMPAKVAKKLLLLFLPVEIFLTCSHKSTELFCVWVKTASFISLAPN